MTVICGALLRKCLELLEKGVHPTVISDSFAKAAAKAVEVLESVAIPVDLGDRESLIKAANTCAVAIRRALQCPYGSRGALAQSQLQLLHVLSCQPGWHACDHPAVGSKLSSEQ